MPSEEELMELAAHMGMLWVLFQSEKKEKKTAMMLSPAQQHQCWSSLGQNFLKEIV